MRILAVISCILLLGVKGYSEEISSHYTKGYSSKTPRHYYFRNYNIEHGLPLNSVNSILQDKLGFMWFGTKDGLSRFDGISFRNFRNDPDDASSLGNNFVTSLYEDADGRIWIGTDSGLYIYNPQKDCFEHFLRKSAEGVQISSAVRMTTGDMYGNIWIAVEAQGIFRYEVGADRLSYFSLERLSEGLGISSNIQCLAFDNSGTVWMGFYGDGLFYSKDNMETIHPYLETDGREVYDNDVVLTLAVGDYNCLYVSSAKTGVQELNLTSGSLRNLLRRDEKGETIFCRNILSVSNEELWLGTESGLYILNTRKGDYSHLRSSMYDKYSLSDNAVYSLCEDREGGIWIGSYFGGVDYLPHTGTDFDKYYPIGENGLHGKRVREFCEDKNGILWIGTEDGGLNRFNPRTKSFSFYRPM